MSDGGSTASTSDRVITYERLNWTVIETEKCDPFFFFEKFQVSYLKSSMIIEILQLSIVLLGLGRVLRLMTGRVE